MNIKIDISFQKDIKKINDKKILTEVKAIIETIKDDENLTEIKNLKKTVSVKRFYRIRLRHYRIGLIISDDTVFFIRFLHRKDIYKYFP